MTQAELEKLALSRATRKARSWYVPIGCKRVGGRKACPCDVCVEERRLVQTANYSSTP